MRPQSRNHSCRIHDNFKIGKLAAVVLENEKLRITVVAGRGADVVEFLHKPDDLDLVWLSVKGLADGEVNYNYQDPLGTFIDEYPGGWQTIFPNGGAASNDQGADFGWRHFARARGVAEVGQASCRCSARSRCDRHDSRTRRAPALKHRHG